MTGKFWIRAVGVLTCMTAVGAGWDAEAARWHCHRRASCCCAPVCCEPVCCEPVSCQPACCETACGTACVTYVTNGCCVADTGYRVIRETVVVPARPCCDGSTAGTPPKDASSDRVAAAATPRAADGAKSVVTSLQR